MGGMLILLLLMGAMWWFTIRPQQQRLKAQRELVASIGTGDIVVTAGGVVGRIVTLDEEEVLLDVGAPMAPVEIRVARVAVTRRLTDDVVDDAQ